MSLDDIQRTASSVMGNCCSSNASHIKMSPAAEVQKPKVTIIIYGIEVSNILICLFNALSLNTRRQRRLWKLVPTLKK